MFMYNVLQVCLDCHSMNTNNFNGNLCVLVTVTTCNVLHVNAHLYVINTDLQHGLKFKIFELHESFV